MTLQIPYPRRGTLRFGERLVPFGDRTLVMGIVNATPDSFAGDGLDRRVDRAVALAREMVAEGADLIDVGGESTRPGARPVETSEELDRVLPTIAAIAAAVPVPVSVDTRKAAVADAALRVGARVVNDVAGLQRDPEMADVVATHAAGLVLMHSPGEPWDVAWPARYQDVVEEVKVYLARSLDLAARAGVGADHVLIDPGFGFGKGAADNFALLRRLGELRTLGRPVLIGTSRKSTIGRVLGLPVEDRLEGSLATLPLAIAEGVDVVRVHDVRPSVRVVRVADAVIRGERG